MKTSLLTLATLAALSSLCAEDNQRAPINPALLYWQAAAQLPNLSTEQVTDLRQIATGKKSVTAAQWKDLGFDFTEKFLLKASESTAPCDWGLLWELGPETTMPHISKMMEMVNIALGEAEFQLTRGDVAQGQRWLLAAHRMARHAGSDDILLSYLVQCAMEQNTLRCTARHCIEWRAPVRQAYQAKLKQLPPLHSLQQAYDGEGRFATWLNEFVHKSAAERVAELKTLASMETQRNGKGLSRDETDELMALQDPAKLQKALDDLRAAHHKVHEILGKPWAIAHPELMALRKDIERRGSILSLLNTPVIETIVDKASSVATLQTMLDAGLQYGDQLDAAHAAEFHDSFEGLPLKMKKDSDGSITLQCATVPPGGKLTDLRLSK